MYVQSKEKSKLDLKSRKCIFLRFEKCIKVTDLRIQQPINIIFDEKHMIKERYVIDEIVSRSS